MSISQELIQDLQSITTKLQDVVSDVQKLIEPKVVEEPISEEELRIRKALNNLGKAMYKSYLAIQIDDMRMNFKGTAGIVEYHHPNVGFDKVPEKHTYWVTKDKFDVTVWDELVVGKCYYIETHKFVKEGRKVDRWVWVSAEEIPYDVAERAIPVSETYSPSVQKYLKDHS